MDCEGLDRPVARSEEDQSEVQHTSSPLAVVESVGGRLHFHWGIGNELFCCDMVMDTVPCRDLEDDSVSTSSCIRWGRQGPAQRRVAYDASSKYVDYAVRMNTRNMLRKKDDSLGMIAGQANGDALEFAQSISDILGSTSLSSADETDDMFLVIEEKALWDLLCSFVFDSATHKQIQYGIPDISSWYYGNATAMSGVPSDAPLSEEMMQNLQKLDVPELESAYWSIFLRLVALGWISDALDVLSLHSAWLQWDSSSDEKTPADIAVLENISSLLRRFPSLNDQSSCGASLTRRFDNQDELLAYRKSWLQQCENLQEESSMWNACAEKAPETKDGCSACLNILLGNEKSIVHSVHSWCELFIASITHRYPDLSSLSELKQILLDATSTMPPQNPFQHAVASIIEHCCDMDHQAIIRACSHVVSDWFLCHIPLVLEVHPSGPGPLHMPLPHAGCDQSEFFRLDYACTLASSSLTWQLALRYLGFCASHGKAVFESLCRMLPLCTSGTLARQAVKLAEEYGLNHICRIIQKQQGTVFLQNGLYGLAAYWFSLAGDVSSMDICLGGFTATEMFTMLDGEAYNVNDLEQCVDAVQCTANLEPGTNYAVLITIICAHQKSRRSFERVTTVLRSADDQLKVYCMQFLIDSIPEIQPGFLKKEDLSLLLEYINLMNSTDRLEAITASRKRLIQLLALLDIRAK